MKRVVSVLVVFLLCLSLFSGCDGSSPSGEPDPSPSSSGGQPVDPSGSPSPGDPTDGPTPGNSPSPTDKPSPIPPANLVEYKGPLYHVFYHFLIAFPEIAYNDSYGKNLDTDCVTPTEFWRSLEELHKNGFVLCNLNDYIVRNDDGTVSNKPIMVPEGKKPLIMSFDDLSYLQRNLGHGIPDKVIIDENGDFAMYTMPKNASEPLITYDNDVIPLLEKFCEQYPDFSPFGAKGLLALTGFDGILGYRTNRDSPNRESEIEAVKPIVAKLKENGWYFGSHSYGHIHLAGVTLDRVKEDTQHWKDEVGTLVGETDIYVFAFGEYPKHDDARFQHLLQSGFKILCGVGMPPYFKKYDKYAFMDRSFIDGNSLRKQHKYLAPLMDPYYVYCQEERGGVPLTTPTPTPAPSPSPSPSPSPGVSPTMPPSDADTSPSPDPSPDVSPTLSGGFRFSDSTITLAFGGDTLIYGTIASALRTGGASAVVENPLAELFRDADMAVVNLESPYSARGAPQAGKDFTFRSAPGDISFLTDYMGITAVSVANNHVIDYGIDAFFDTLELLDSRGVGHAGGGKNLAEAAKPVLFNSRGKAVALIAASQVAPNMEWYAAESRAGVIMAYDPSDLLRAVRAAKEYCDYVIVYMHWGTEHVETPTARQTGTAHSLIDAGADAVIGAHPHIVQSFEVYKGKPVAYSLGNFIFGSSKPDTAAVRLYIDDEGVVMEVVPCRISGTRTGLPGEKERARMLAHFREISPGADIDDDGILRPA